MQEEKEEQYVIHHKIEPGRKYRVWKNTVNDVDYYRIGFTQKNYDGTSSQHYESVVFKKGVSLPNQSDIIIKEAYENVRTNPKDSYNPIHYLNITEFELQQSQEQITEAALNEYNETIEESEIKIDDNFLD